MTRRQVKKISPQIDKLASINLASLQRTGIRGIILDLDNTIVSEDDRYLSPGVEAWIKHALALGFKLFILSNGKRRYRVVYWSRRLGIVAFSPAHKPFGAGFQRALASMRLLPQQVVVIGDSWHTDILGAGWAGCYSIQVATLPHPPRWWERIVGRWVQIPYQHPWELWAVDPAVALLKEGSL